MIRITSLLVILSTVSFCQTVAIKNPERIATEQTRNAYKRNAVRGVTTIGFKNLSDADNNVNGNIEEIDVLDKNGFVISSRDILGPGREMTMTQKFDSSGNLLGFRQFLNDQFSEESIFYYDNNNILVSRVTIKADSKGPGRLSGWKKGDDQWTRGVCGEND
jgi:hypothetical protein